MTNATTETMNDTMNDTTYKCQINGLDTCDTCRHNEIPAAEECKKCFNLRCPLGQGGSIKNCDRCNWEGVEV